MLYTFMYTNQCSFVNIDLFVNDDVYICLAIRDNGVEDDLFPLCLHVVFTKTRQNDSLLTS
jgi:hypothetical protein